MRVIAFIIGFFMALVGLVFPPMGAVACILTFIFLGAAGCFNDEK